MPDHVHIILTPLADETRRTTISLVEIMKAIKGASAHAITRKAGNHATVWQEESFDRVVRSSESLDAKVASILQKPSTQRLGRELAPLSLDLAPPPVNNPYAPPAN